MTQLRGNKPIKLTNKQDIEVQIIDWYTDNKIVEEDVLSGSESESEEPDSDDSSDESKSSYKVKDKEFMIKAYGVTLKGNSISITINGYLTDFT